MKIYVGRGGMLQYIKLVQAENVTIYNSFLCGVRERDYNFTTNKILHIYSQDASVYLNSHFLCP
jgi:hypothetical protein